MLEKSEKAVKSSENTEKQGSHVKLNFAKLLNNAVNIAKSC